VSLRLLSYNIQHGGVGRESRIAKVIAACNADVVILQEAVNPESVQRIGAECGMPRWGSIRGHSVGYLSRLDVAHHAWHEVQFAKRRYLELVIASPRVRIYGVHLSAIHSNLTENRRVYELRALLKGIAQHQKGFHLLTGDFNTLAPGEKLDVGKLPPRLRAIVWLTGGTIRWRTIQLMLDGGYIDGYRKFHKDDAGYTFPVWEPHVRLDYAFVPAIFSGRLLKCEIMTDAPGVRQASDHFPLLSEWSDG
jgi:endonuclease/exonuclease/phosphatase family metal-dependent hydrolase